MNELQIFNNSEFGSVRTIQINNEPWFVASDVCSALEITNTTMALERLDEDEKSKFNLGLSGGDTNCVNEYGLYNLVLGSRKKEAKDFKRWITHDVIPSIRKTGGYKIPKTYAEALENLLLEVKENERLVNENETFKAEREILLPKAEFFDAVTDSKQAIAIGDVAKVLDMGVGRNKLFEILRETKVLMPDNRPYQKYIDAGYFRVVEQKYQKNGDTYINLKTLVFQKGIDFIRRKLEKEN